MQIMSPDTAESRSQKYRDTALVAFGISALALTALLVFREFVAPARADPIRPIPHGQWRALIGEGRWIGPPEAPVVVLAFSDFHCEVCREFARDIRDLQRQHPGMLAVAFRHYPLERQPGARAAALAAECSADEDRFVAYHDALFGSQSASSRASLTALARQVGVNDLPRFESCLQTEMPRARLDRDKSVADSLKIRGTPLLFVQGRRFDGRVSKDLLAQLIERAERRQRTPAGAAIPTP
jgi:predicted DsbA family dithiol-disulfide isomerase